MPNKELLEPPVMMILITMMIPRDQKGSLRLSALQYRLRRSGAFHRRVCLAISRFARGVA